MAGKGSISDFFPVPPAHHRVTKCDIAREKLLGILEVSLALEENIVPEYLIQQNLREFVHLSLIENIYFGTHYSVGLLRNRLELRVAYFEVI